MQNNSYKKSNFGIAFFFLSKEQKEALSIIYSFCRYADDIVDEYSKEEAPQLLSNLREELNLVYEGKPLTDLGKDLLKVVKDFDIPKEYLSALLDGMESDLRTEVIYNTYKDLQTYLYQVAIVVGLMCIKICGANIARCKDYAYTLGEAVQMTNILRDISEDSKLSRLYIPLEDLKKFNVSKEDVLNLVDSKNISSLLAFEYERAKTLYQKAESLIPKEDFNKLLVARIMGAIYKGILEKMQKTSCRLAHKKIKLNKIQKLLILVNVWRTKR